MAVRSPTIIGNATPISASEVNEAAKGWVGWVQKIANQAGLGTIETDITSLTVSPTCVEGRQYRITGQFRITPNNDPMEVLGRLYIGATQIDSDQRRSTVVGQNLKLTFQAVYDCPIGAGGVKVFKITGQSQTGSTTYDVNNSSITPGVLLVEDIGII